MTAEEWLKSDAGELAHRVQVSHAMNTDYLVQISIAWQEGVRAGWEACEQSKLKAVRISSPNEETV
jgi:hypothetical protein